MKNVCFFVFFLVGMLSAQNSFAQANNNTEETWVINYYGATTVVNPNTTNVTINVGYNCDEGIDVRSLDTPGCGNGFTAPGTWTATCSTKTDNVVFGSNGGLATCLTQVTGTTYANPTFDFNE